MCSYIDVFFWRCSSTWDQLLYCLTVEDFICSMVHQGRLRSRSYYRRGLPPYDIKQETRRYFFSRHSRWVSEHYSSLKHIWLIAGASSASIFFKTEQNSISLQCVIPDAVEIIHLKCVRFRTVWARVSPVVQWLVQLSQYKGPDFKPPGDPYYRSYYKWFCGPPCYRCRPRTLGWEPLL